MTPLKVPGPAKLLFERGAEPHSRIAERGPPPPWRDFKPKRVRELGSGYHPGDEEIRLVNAALYLRRPLLVTGKPGTGKSTLARAVAHQLGLGDVLVWSITSRSTLQQGLYHYDAVGRLQDASLARSTSAGAEVPDIGKFIRLGPLGTAFRTSTEKKPRVLLIDEIDKSDIDLPNDLLHVFEEGEFEIAELARLAEKSVTVGLQGGGSADINLGRIRCEGFPFVILTSNGEREFAPAFLRRCLRLDIVPPTEQELHKIVSQRLDVAGTDPAIISGLIKDFLDMRNKHEMSTDQLLNAVHLAIHGLSSLSREELERTVFRPLA